MSVLQENLIGSDIIVVEWQFLLPQNHPNRQVAYKRASTSSSGMIGKVGVVMNVLLLLWQHI